MELLSAAQQADGHLVHVIASVGPEVGEHPFVAALRRRHVPVTVIALPSRAYLAERAELRRLLTGMAPDVVHTHGYRTDVLVARVARRLGLRTVSTAHGFVGGSARNRIYEWIQLRTWRSLDAVVAVSRPLVARLKAAGIPDDRIHCIRNAWAADRPPLPRLEARRQLGLPLEGPIIGWVGRLSREKGADVMIDALSLMTEPAVLSIVGGGPDREALAAHAERVGVAGRLYWGGVLPEVGQLFTAFDCFVLSSRTEGTPMSLFEAMAACIPVVATAVGGVPDVVSPREGSLVPPEDPVALARTLDVVLRDRAVALERAAAAQRRLETEFSVARWLEAYDAVYSHALGALAASV